MRHVRSTALRRVHGRPVEVGVLIGCLRFSGSVALRAPARARALVRKTGNFMSLPGDNRPAVLGQMERSMMRLRREQSALEGAALVAVDNLGSPSSPGALQASAPIAVSPRRAPDSTAAGGSAADIGATLRPPLDRVRVRDITVTLGDVSRVAPVLTFHPQERHYPCGIADLLDGARLVGADGQTLVVNPTGADLGRHAAVENRLCLHARHAAGSASPADNLIRAPMYVAVQVPENRAHVDLRYILLFGYQGAQVVRVTVPGNAFDTFVPHFGEHQGDIESVCVRLTPDLKQVTHVTFEHHGRPEVQLADHVTFLDGHPLARCALADHATFNACGRDAHARVEHAEEVRQPIPGFGVSFVDMISAHGARWAPHELPSDTEAFVFVGRNDTAEAINQQLWTAFAGTIGKAWRNDFCGARGIERPLWFWQRLYVDSVVAAVVACGGVAEHHRASNGTAGLGRRSWLTMAP